MWLWGISRWNSQQSLAQCKHYMYFKFYYLFLWVLFFASCICALYLSPIYEKILMNFETSNRTIQTKITQIRVQISLWWMLWSLTNLLFLIWKMSILPIISSCRVQSMWKDQYIPSNTAPGGHYLCLLLLYFVLWRCFMGQVKHPMFVISLFYRGEMIRFNYYLLFYGLINQ